MMRKVYVQILQNGLKSTQFSNRSQYRLNAPYKSRSFCTSSEPIIDAAVQSQNEEVATTISPLAIALKPREVVEQLNKYIVGQPEAKRAVAIALRNRWRRHRLNDDLKNEVIPKNILMIGPTGCGKTEIARRMAKLCQAPFIKVEATKFTEVGFHGKDVDTIIRDLVDISINMTKKRIKEEIKQKVAYAVEERILDTLVEGESISVDEIGPEKTNRDSFRSNLRDGLLEENTIEIEVPSKSEKGNGAVMEGFPMAIGNFNDIFKVGRSGKRVDRKKLKVKDARPILEEMESEKMLDDYDVTREAIAAVEESGIVFIDEIDKLVSGNDFRGADASSEGVQRDLLPLIEGMTVSTKYGNVNTDFILFIASGAFHASKPSDLLAELQGRLPIRVSLKGLTQEDLYSILTEPVTNLIRQQVELLQSEGVHLSFSDGAIREIARVSFVTNKSVENIGARRLHTVIERVMEEISFDAPDKAGEQIEITEDYVKKRVSDLLTSSDLRRYII